ncbi:MAG: T9SS type A sorting domain-containing protein [Cytophagales bacterium]|nr:T9SS type A sorting domain-containing protein [Cytophagales bacterium]
MRLTSLYKIFFLTTSLLSSLTGFSQLFLDYPVNRMVIQRENNGYADLQIAGFVTQKIDKIEARLSPFKSGQGIDTGWQIISTSPKASQFIGKIRAYGGWYKLEVRASYNNQLVAYTGVDHVGIGEVFVISGQSNAEGNEVYEGGSTGTIEDRVSVINYKDSFMEEDKLPFFFSPLKDNTKIGPYNPVPWFWAGFAEKIVAEYNVPVLLFGSAVGGMGSEFWHGSMKGIDYTGPYAIQVKFPGSPYGVIKRTLQNYISRTGARAILWQQGESDAFTDPYTYFTRLKDVSQQTAIDIDANLKWIMAISSRTPNPTNAAYAQQLTIDNLSNVYQGPNTDYIHGSEYRADGIHFHKEGLKLASTLWFEAIKSQNLLQVIEPIKPKDFFYLNVACSSENSSSLTATVPNGYDTPVWSNGSTAFAQELDSDLMNAKARKKGVVYFSPRLQLNQKEFKSEDISITGSTEFCEGSTSNYINSTASLPQWNTGETSLSILPKQTGNYYFKWNNIYGCQFTSDTVGIKIHPKPIPQITFSTGQPRFCEDESIILSTAKQYKTYIWAENENTPTFETSTSDNISLVVTDENGCESDLLNSRVELLNNPEPPIISKLSPFTLEANPLSVGQPLIWYKDNVDLNYSSPQLKVTEAGNYQAKTWLEYYSSSMPTYTCFSELSNEVVLMNDDFDPPIRIWPNPATSEIQVEMTYEPQDLNLLVYSVDGKLVDKTIVSFDKGSPIYSVKNLESGNYFIKLGSRSNYVVHKLSVQH